MIGPLVIQNNIIAKKAETIRAIADPAMPIGFAQRNVLPYGI
jgi:hypothetical protein